VNKPDKLTDIPKKINKIREKNDEISQELEELKEDYIDSVNHVKEVLMEKIDKTLEAYAPSKLEIIGGKIH
jgi:hypothetical protein